MVFLQDVTHSIPCDVEMARSVPRSYSGPRNGPRTWQGAVSESSGMTVEDLRAPRVASIALNCGFARNVASWIASWFVTACEMLFAVVCLQLLQRSVKLREFLRSVQSSIAESGHSSQ